MHIERQRENIMPSVAVSQIKRTRTCPLCAKEGIKHLSDHLKGKHKMTSAKERAPHLKRSLTFQKAKTINGDNATVVSNKAVKCAVTVCEEPNNEVRRDATDEFREQERILGASFQQIEDDIVALRLRAMQTTQSAMSKIRIRMEVRERLIPLYGMVMQSLETSLCDIVPPTQLKRTNEHRNTRSPEPKRKKKNESKHRATDVSEAMVRFSTSGMDFLTDGLVRCQTCCISWDAEMSYKCLCGHYYNGPDRDNLDMKVNRETGLDCLENGLVRCQACHFEWDGNAQHECAYDAAAEDSEM